MKTNGRTAAIMAFFQANPGWHAAIELKEEGVDIGAAVGSLLLQQANAGKLQRKEVDERINGRLCKRVYYRWPERYDGAIFELLIGKAPAKSEGYRVNLEDTRHNGRGLMPPRLASSAMLGI